MAAQAALGGLDHAMSPLPQTGAAVELLASTALTTDLSGAVSAVVGVSQFRRVTLWISADVGAAGAYAHIVPLVSAEAAQPAIGDDSWYALAERDASAVATLLTGAVPTGADFTIAPEWAVVTCRPLVIRTELGDAGTDKIRMAVTIDVSHARWLYVATEEVSANMTVAIKWSGSL